MELAKGYFGRKKNVWTVAKNAIEKGLVYAYRDRKAKKREFRSLWIARINAGARLHGMSYSQFMGKAKKSNIDLSDEDSESDFNNDYSSIISYSNENNDENYEDNIEASIFIYK